MDIYEEVIFDLETQKFFDEVEADSKGRFDPGDLGVSILSLYRRTLDKDFNEIKGEMLSFWEDELEKTYEIFAKAKRIIGFNSKRFDVPAMRPYFPTNFQTFEKLPHFDILEFVKEINGKRVSLNAISKETLGDHKVDDPRNAIIYWRKKDPESLKKLKYYCEQDVALTKQVYDFGMKNKKLKFKDYWNTLREIEVDFSYPVIKSPVEEQVSLF